MKKASQRAFLGTRGSWGLVAFKSYMEGLQRWGRGFPTFWHKRTKWLTPYRCVELTLDLGLYWRLHPLWGRTRSITSTGYLSHLTIWTHCSLPLMHANISAVWTACRHRNFSGFASWTVFCPWPKQARTCKKLGFLPFSYHSLYQMQNLQGNRYKWKATHEALRERIWRISHGFMQGKEECPRGRIPVEG